MLLTWFDGTMFNKQQQFEFPGSACPSCGYWPVTLCNEMKWNEMKPERRHQCWDLSLLLGLGEEGTDSWCWAAFIPRMCYRHYSMLIKKKKINKNRVLEKDVADLFVKQPAVQIRVLVPCEGFSDWDRAILEGQGRCKVANYLSALALSCDDGMECFQNCSVVPLLS